MKLIYSDTSLFQLNIQHVCPQPFAEQFVERMISSQHTGEFWYCNAWKFESGSSCWISFQAVLPLTWRDFEDNKSENGYIPYAGEERAEGTKT